MSAIISSSTESFHANGSVITTREIAPQDEQSTRPAAPTTPGDTIASPDNEVQVQALFHLSRFPRNIMEKTEALAGKFMTIPPTASGKRLLPMDPTQARQLKLAHEASKRAIREHGLSLQAKDESALAMAGAVADLPAESIAREQAVSAFCSMLPKMSIKGAETALKLLITVANKHEYKQIQKARPLTLTLLQAKDRAFHWNAPTLRYREPGTS